MDKPHPKQAGASDANRSTALDLALAPLINKKPRNQGGSAAQLQAKKLVDNTGAPTVEGLKLQIESMIQELSDKIDCNTAAVVAKVNEGEAAVHKQAKADHAKTCQVLQDSQAAMDLAAQQHAAATKQVQQVGRAAAATVQSVAKEAAQGLKSTVAKFEKDIAALRAKAGIKA